MKIKVKEATIVVRGITHNNVEKPYYEIKYQEIGKNYCNVGYGSYNIKNVLQWLEEEFEFVSEGSKVK